VFGKQFIHVYLAAQANFSRNQQQQQHQQQYGSITVREMSENGNSVHRLNK
jgi:hypothetical protein